MNALTGNAQNHAVRSIYIIVPLKAGIRQKNGSPNPHPSLVGRGRGRGKIPVIKNYLRF
jgi:hypothetical protein